MDPRHSRVQTDARTRSRILPRVRARAGHAEHGRAARSPMHSLAADSFAVARTPAGRPLLDSTTRSAVQRARSEALPFRPELGSQPPTTLRAHAAMVDAYVSVRNYAGGDGEVARFRADHARASGAAVRRSPGSLCLGRHRPRRGQLQRHSTPWRHRTSAATREPPRW